MTIHLNVEQIKKKIGSARLMAVTKYRSIAEIQEAIAAGVDLIGESRVQEAMGKLGELPSVEKHFIGHLQTNKVKKAVELFDCIQSVDRYGIAKEIDKCAARMSKVMPVMIEINPCEEQKGGVSFEDAPAFYNKIVGFRSIKVVGVMGIGPLTEDPREFFQKMKQLQVKLGVKECSMGMSEDWQTAVEEGSTLVRIGKGVFS
ncbi:MAG: YggS family pyridoxal phosphate-dependent enzyme [Nanoarchaeota archaeon]